MLFHNILGNHHADVDASTWQRGRHTSNCTICGRPMTKLPGLPWTVTNPFA